VQLATTAFVQQAIGAFGAGDMLIATYDSNADGKVDAADLADAVPWAGKRQAILVGMGVHTGFADLIVLCGGRVLFLELKSLKGRLSPAQEAFRDTVLAQGFGWALVRSLDDALSALADHGFTTRIASPSGRVAP
jgi:hypothetical protein